MWQDVKFNNQKSYLAHERVQHLFENLARGKLNTVLRIYRFPTLANQSPSEVGPMVMPRQVFASKGET